MICKVWEGKNTCTVIPPKHCPCTKQLHKLILPSYIPLPESNALWRCKSATVRNLCISCLSPFHYFLFLLTNKDLAVWLWKKVTFPFSRAHAVLSSTKQRSFGVTVTQQWDHCLMADDTQMCNRHTMKKKLRALRQEVVQRDGGYNKLHS